MRLLYPSRQKVRLRVMLVLVHVDITPPHTSLQVIRRIGERTIPYSWRAYGDTPDLHLHNLGTELEPSQLGTEHGILQPLALVVSAATAHKTFGPTDLTSTYSVCTRRVFGGIVHRT
ncbi:hypothetical protein TNCV_2679531 [Trichonephila clavipes]|nr:hypothetical protein TNCV_2679531 [Trichonephila clavipes]